MQDDPSLSNWFAGLLTSALGVLTLWNWNKVNRDIRDANRRIDGKADKSEMDDIKNVMARNQEREEERHRENIGRMDTIIQGQTAIWQHLAGNR